MLCFVEALKHQWKGFDHDWFNCVRDPSVKGSQSRLVHLRQRPISERVSITIGPTASEIYQRGFNYDWFICVRGPSEKFQSQLVQLRQRPISERVSITIGSTASEAHQRSFNHDCFNCVRDPSEKFQSRLFHSVRLLSTDPLSWIRLSKCSVCVLVQRTGVLDWKGREWL